jgi:hypothetical protein
LWYSVNFVKQIERSVSLSLGILGNLDHFRNSFISLYQSVIERGCSKDTYDKVEIFNHYLSIANHFTMKKLSPDQLIFTLLLGVIILGLAIYRMFK